MKARHSIFTREISSPPCNIVQMKICNDDLLPKVARLPLFAGCASGEIKSILEDVQGKLHQFEAGEVILHECMPAVLMVVVVSGVVFVRECGLTDDSRPATRSATVCSFTLSGARKTELPSLVKFRYGELAEYLGVNRTALYRAIAKLRKSGKIRIEDDTLALA